MKMNLHSLGLAAPPEAPKQRSRPASRPATFALADRPTIMHVTHTLGRGGVEVLVQDLIEAMNDRYRFVVVALDERGPLARALRRTGTPVHVIGRRPGLDWRCAARIAKLAARHNVDVIHAHQYTPFFYAALAQLWGSGQSKLIFTEHGRHWPDRRRLRRALANRLWLLRRADRITAVGQFVRQALIDNEAVPADQIDVVYNGIVTERFAPGDELDVRRARVKLHLHPDEPVILQVAGFRDVKDHATALRALKCLHERGCRATLLLAGIGPTLEPTRHLAEELKLIDHVHFLGDRPDVPQLWQAADVGLLSSVSEGISVALLEAMAASRSVVATDVGGNPEIVRDGQTGYLAPRGDAGKLAQALHRLLCDADLRRRLGESGRQRVVRLFDQQRMHAAYEQMYRDLCQEQRNHVA